MLLYYEVLILLPHFLCAFLFSFFAFCALIRLVYSFYLSASNFFGMPSLLYLCFFIDTNLSKSVSVSTRFRFASFFPHEDLEKRSRTFSFLSFFVRYFSCIPCEMFSVNGVRERRLRLISWRGTPVNFRGPSTRT